MVEDTKKLTIGVAGTEGKQEYKDVKVPPGTRAKDILTQLGLNGMALKKANGGEFAGNEEIYPAISDGQKLYATKANSVEAGS